jgi:hypothetical protein
MFEPVTSAAAEYHPRTTDLPEPVADILATELEPGEHVVWSGQPLAQKSAKGTIPVVMFGIPWTAFALFWTWGASKGSFMFGLFGVPFVLIGLGMLSSPVWAMRSARGSAYIITNRRALIITKTVNGVSVRTIHTSQMKNLERTQAADGSGNISFSLKDNEQSLSFTAIADVAGVERKLRALVASVEQRLP